MSFPVFVGIVAVMFVIELPDKTMMATIVMSTRARALMIALGASAAYLVQMGIAVGAGGLLTLIPHDAKQIVIGLLFLGGAGYLLFVPESKEVEAANKRAVTPAAPYVWREALTAFTVIFVSEFGDLSQIQAANFVARTRQPLEVYLAGSLALCSLAFIGAFGGAALQRHLPLVVIRRVGGLVFAGLGIYTFVQLATS